MSALSAEYLTPGEVAETLKCSRWLVYDLIDEGLLRSVRLGSGPKARHRIPGDALAEFARGSESPARSAADRSSEAAVEPLAHGEGPTKGEA